MNVGKLATIPIIGLGTSYASTYTAGDIAPLTIDAIASTGVSTAGYAAIIALLVAVLIGVMAWKKWGRRN